MLNIVLPIAGRGSRFAAAGYELPKPLIPVHGVPMIELVVHNVRPRVPHRFIFLALDEHLQHLGMRATLERAAPGCEIVPVDAGHRRRGVHRAAGARPDRLRRAADARQQRPVGRRPRSTTTLRRWTTRTPTA